MCAAETVALSVVLLSVVAGATVTGSFEGVSVLMDVTDGSVVDNSSGNTADVSSVDTSFVDVETAVAEGLTAAALHRKPLKFSASLAKKLTFVPRSVVTMNLGPSRPQ